MEIDISTPRRFYPMNPLDLEFMENPLKGDAFPWKIANDLDDV